MKQAGNYLVRSTLMRSVSTTKLQWWRPRPSSSRPPSSTPCLWPALSAQRCATTGDRASDRWTPASVLSQPGLVLHPRQVLLHRLGGVGNRADGAQLSAGIEAQGPAAGEKQQRHGAVAGPRRPAQEIRERAAERDAEQHRAQESDDRRDG